MALSFDNRYFEGNFSGLNGSNELTISTWVWINSVSTFDNTFDTGIFCGQAHNNPVLFWYNPNGAPFLEDNCFTINVGSPAEYSNRINSSTNSGNNALQQWCHVVGVMDGSIRRIYINGILDGEQLSADETVVTIGDSDNFRIGGWSQTDDFTASNDKFAQLGVWDRALSLGEIEGLAKGAMPMSYLNNLKLYFPFTEDSRELINGVPMTASGGGTITKYDSPRIYGIGDING